MLSAPPLLAVAVHDALPVTPAHPETAMAMMAKGSIQRMPPAAWSKLVIDISIFVASLWK